MKISVSRSNPAEPFRVYEVPVGESVITVMDALEYIYRHLDHTLAFFRHSACRQGVCGRCGVRLNGRPVLACAEVIDPSLSEICIEPRAGRVVCDLVVKEP